MMYSVFCMVVRVRQKSSQRSKLPLGRRLRFHPLTLQVARIKLVLLRYLRREAIKYHLFITLGKRKIESDPKENSL